MSTATIYVKATHKTKEKSGHFCYQVTKPDGKSPIEKDGKFSSESKVQTQLTTLIKSISAIKKSVKVEEVELVTDFSLIQNFLDGTIFQWEQGGWVKENGKELPSAELWKELSELAVQQNVRFAFPEENDETMADLSKRIKSLGEKPKRRSSKIKESTSTPVAEKTVDSPVVEEVVQENENMSTTTVKKKKAANKDNSKKIDDSKETHVTNTKNTAKIQNSSATLGGITVDKKLLEDSEELFQELGMDVNMAVTIFLKHSLRNKGLTLDLKL